MGGEFELELEFVAGLGGYVADWAVGWRVMMSERVWFRIESRENGLKSNGRVEIVGSI